MEKSQKSESLFQLFEKKSVISGLLHIIFPELSAGYLFFLSLLFSDYTKLHKKTYFSPNLWLKYSKNHHLVKSYKSNPNDLLLKRKIQSAIHIPKSLKNK